MTAPGLRRPSPAGEALADQRRLVVLPGPVDDGAAAGGALREPLSEPAVWVVSAAADVCRADERAAFAVAASAEEAAGPAIRLLLETCHRAELFGIGPGPGPDALAEAALAGRLRVLRGAAAVRHVLRLAAGLESAVVGEDQVLHQVRELREAARARRLEPELVRLLETAIAVGRRCRAARAPAPGRRGEAAGETGLAGPAFDWLEAAGASLAGGAVLVVGSGPMGRLLVREARRRGARPLVASRDPIHAAGLTEPDSPALDLEAAAAAAPAVVAIAVALGGPWSALARGAVPAAGLPPLVDLSAPPAVPPGRASVQVDIDGLYEWTGPAALRDAPRQPASDGVADYTERADRIVAEATERYLRWAAGRASRAVLVELRRRFAARRMAALERLLRRLPELTPRQQALIATFGEQLTAGLLHAPTAALREDADGSAAAAARRLFDL